jgi:hypothetical protein
LEYIPKAAPPEPSTGAEADVAGATGSSSGTKPLEGLISAVGSSGTKAMIIYSVQLICH